MRLGVRAVREPGLHPDTVVHLECACYLRGWRMRLLTCIVPLIALASAGARPRTPARDLVTLEMITGARDGCADAAVDFVRTLPDGMAAADVFRVPEGRLLVVTDLDWQYLSGPPGSTAILRVMVQNLADKAKRRRVFESTVRIGADGATGASEHMTTGFVVSSHARVCLDLVPGPLGSPLRISKVLMRGYLADE